MCSSILSIILHYFSHPAVVGKWDDDDDDDDDTRLTYDVKDQWYTELVTVPAVLAALHNSNETFNNEYRISKSIYGIAVFGILNIQKN